MTTTVTPHLFIPGPTNIPDAVRMAIRRAADVLAGMLEDAA